MSAGRHTVFVRAKDADGNWGAVSAIFLEVATTQPPPTEDGGPCEPNRETLCLQDSRYAVTVEWRKPDGETGVAGVVNAARTNDSGLFTFFSPDNWEILIKVLDGCALNGHVWVYAASTTDLGYTIRVTDMLTEAVKEYENEPGVAAPTITDGTAFLEGCRP